MTVSQLLTFNQMGPPPEALLPVLVCLLCWTGTSTVTFECVRDTDLVLIHSNKLNYTELEGTHVARISDSGNCRASLLSQPAASIISGWFLSQVGDLSPSSPGGCSLRRSIWFSSSAVN